MRGHIRPHRNVWAVVVDLGRCKARRCPDCNRRQWVADDPFRDECSRCGAGLLEPASERRQQWFSGYRTRKEAEKALPTLLEPAQGGEYVTAPPNDDETLGEFLATWLKGRSNLKPTTAENYRINIECYIVPRIGRVALRSLDARTLDRFYAELLASGGRDKKPLSPKTVRNVHLVLHRALATAVKQEHARPGKQRRMSENPAAFCEQVPRLERRKRSGELSVWSPEQTRAFLASVADDRLYAAWRLVALTGLRRGEVLGVRPEDLTLDAIDPETGEKCSEVTVAQTVTLVAHKPVISTPKSTDSGRTIALDPETVASLRDYRKRALADRLAWGPAHIASGFFFTREDGSPIHPERFSAWFKQRAKRAGLPVIRLHDLRHSHATAGLQAGVPLKVMSERLGHANIGITADLYSHVLRAMDQDAAAKIAHAIDG